MAKSDEFAQKAEGLFNDLASDSRLIRGIGFAILALVAAIKEKEASDKDQFKLM